MKFKGIRNLLRPSNKKKWNKEYESDYWELLKSPLENERFLAVCEAIRKLGKFGKIMEVGCGEGLLERKMEAGLYSRFVGIDFSRVAIKRATALNRSNVEYKCVDMEKYVTREKFDYIIFNESLYYSKQPVKLVEKYMQFLAPNKFLITSIYETPSNLKLIYLLKERFSFIEHKTTSNERGNWHCIVFINTEVPALPA